MEAASLRPEVLLLQMGYALFKRVSLLPCKNKTIQAIDIIFLFLLSTFND